MGVRREPIPADLLAVMCEHRERRDRLAAKTGAAWFTFDEMAQKWKAAARQSYREEKEIVDERIRELFFADLRDDQETPRVTADYDAGVFVIQEEEG